MPRSLDCDYGLVVYEIKIFLHSSILERERGPKQTPSVEPRACVACRRDHMGKSYTLIERGHSLFGGVIGVVRRVLATKLCENPQGFRVRQECFDSDEKIVRI